MKNNITEERQKELKTLAVDIKEGKVFTDKHCATKEDFDKSFAIVSLFEESSRRKEIIEKINSGEITTFYEYMNKSGPIAINGNPVFFSCNILNYEESKYVFTLINKMIEAEETLLKVIDKDD